MPQGSWMAWATSALTTELRQPVNHQPSQSWHFTLQQSPSWAVFSLCWMFSSSSWNYPSQLHSQAHPEDQLFRHVYLMQQAPYIITITTTFTTTCVSRCDIWILVLSWKIMNKVGITELRHDGHSIGLLIQWPTCIMGSCDHCHAHLESAFPCSPYKYCGGWLPCIHVALYPSSSPLKWGEMLDDLIMYPVM